MPTRYIRARVLWSVQGPAEAISLTVRPRTRVCTGTGTPVQYLYVFWRALQNISLIDIVVGESLVRETYRLYPATAIKQLLEL